MSFNGRLSSVPPSAPWAVQPDGDLGVRLIPSFPNERVDNVLGFQVVVRPEAGTDSKLKRCKFGGVAEHSGGAIQDFASGRIEDARFMASVLAFHHDEPQSFPLGLEPALHPGSVWLNSSREATSVRAESAKGIIQASTAKPTVTERSVEWFSDGAGPFPLTTNASGSLFRMRPRTQGCRVLRNWETQ